jgi:hypothetical protein
MTRTVERVGSYKSNTSATPSNSAHGTVANEWERICKQHQAEFPCIRTLHPGTFNLLLTERYDPPDDNRYREMAKKRGLQYLIDGNHIAPCARVIEIDGHRVQCWIYRGGHGNEPVLELLSHYPLGRALEISENQNVKIIIEEVCEGSFGMPGLPGHHLF